jgi:hypothetical protein
MEQHNAITHSPVEIESMVNLPIIDVEAVSDTRTFILANTVEGNFQEIKNTHLVPVFSRCNSPLISQADFITVTQEAVKEFFGDVEILPPAIRLSHEIKGRIPSARNKPAHQLEDHEITLMYDKMMFAIDIPSIHDTINGNKVSLTVGGVKSYTEDNLNSKKGAETFSIFVGFQNQVCLNMCLFSTGVVDKLKVTNLGQLKACIYSMLNNYNQGYHLFHLKKLTEYSLTEGMFAHLLGKCRMYHYLPTDVKKEIPQLLYSDSQLSSVVKDYYRDSSFCKDNQGNINLWKLYNLFTGSNKSSYIDRFLDRSVNAFNLVEQIRFELEGKTASWYLG